MEFRRGSATALAKSVPNGHSFNGKSIYDGVFGGQRNADRSVIEDYGEIFGGSGASIPVLEVSELNESKLVVDVRSSKLDYSKIFGGFADFEFAASHEELFLAKHKLENESPPKSPPLSESSVPSSFPVAIEVSSHEASHESFDGKKEVILLYNRTSPGSENGTNGTMHVAQLHDVPGYSFIIDERTQDDKPVPSALHEKCPTSDGNMGVKHYRRTMSELPPGVAYNQSSGGVREVQNKSHGNGSHRSGMVSEVHEVDVCKHPSNVRRASSLPKSADSSKCGCSKWASISHFTGDVTGLSSPPNLDEEVDENSVAATSAAAVTKAIEEAQASIKIALELMERKKESNLKPSFDGLKVNEKTSSKRKTNALKSAQVVPDLGHIETLKNEATREMHGKNLKLFQTSQGKEETEKRESAKQGEKLDNVMQFINECGPEEKRTNEGQKKDGKKVDTMKESDLQESENELKSSGEVLDQKEDGNKLIFARIWDKIEEMLRVSTDQEAFGGKVNQLEEDAHQCMLDNEEKQNEALQEESCLESNDLPRTVESQTVLQDLTIQEKCQKGFEDASEVIKPEEELEVFCGLEENYEKDDVCIGDHAETPSDEIEEMETSEEGLNGFQYEEENDSKLEEEEKAGGNVEESGNVIKEAFEIKDSEDIREGTSEEENTDRIPDEVDHCVEGTKTGDTEEGQRGTPEWVSTHMIQKDNDHNVEGEKTGENEERQIGTSEWVGTHLLQEETYQSVESKKIGDNEGRPRGASEWVDTHAIQEETVQRVEDEETGENEERQSRTSEWVNSHVVQEESDQSAESEKTGETEEVHKCHMNVSETAEDASKQVEMQNPMENQEPCRDECFEGVEINQEKFACDENLAIEEPTEACFEFKETRREHEAVEADNNVEYAGVLDTSGLAESISELDEIKWQMESDGAVLGLGKNRKNVSLVYLTFEQIQHDQQEKESDVFCKIETSLEELECELVEGNPDFEVDGVEEQQENKNIPESRDGVRFVDDGECIGAEQPPCIFEKKEETVRVACEDLANQSTEKYEGKHCETPKEIMLESKATSMKEMDVNKEERRKRDEAKERKREREMERKAVERAVREARERAFAEAREKAERAAAERVNAEARRREMSEARGKMEKPSAEADDKTFMESKIKSERAAVERATAEARQRALEKAMSEKASFNARNQADKFSSERLSSSSRDNGTKHNIRPYDSHSNVYDHSASSRNTSSSINSVVHTSERFDGANGEPAQRGKARLERHQRTAERAAKALEEKNMRDLLAQKEQAERNRLAETLDSEVKRWAKGKEGNLRALLSTLQYILGPESGWQPIPLTDLIATAAVKKAYRKSTLYVHPDKLQQRGASIQQTYTCEKVFDLLKAAWNKFNAEER